MIFGAQNLKITGLVMGYLLVVLSSSAIAEDYILRMGTGSLSGTSYAVGKTIAATISKPQEDAELSCDKGGTCGVPGLLVIVQTSEGSAQNLAGLQNATIDMALTQSDLAYWAFRGEELYSQREPFVNIRAIGYLYPKLLHVITNRDSPIKRLSDLRGRRVSLGAFQSGTVVNARQVLQSFGAKETDLEAYFMSTDSAIDGLLSGQLDALFLMSGAPTPSIEFLQSEMQIRLLSLHQNTVNSLLNVNAYFAPNTIPAGTYIGIPDVSTVSIGILLLVGAHLENDMVHDMTRALWHKSNRRFLSAGPEKSAIFTAEKAIRNVPIPFHDGALKYYQDRALLPSD